MRTLVVNQPTYLPWLGYFDILRRADVFVVYDHVQFSRQSWQQRNRIRDRRGPLLLTVPVLHRGKGPQALCEVEVDRTKDFATKHLRAIHANYARAPRFRELFPELEVLYAAAPERLAELNWSLIRWGMEKLGVRTTVFFSRDLGVEGRNVDALLELCERFGADRYMSPAGARDYIGDGEAFAERGIRLEYQAYEHPVYPQLDHPDFVSHLSFIDFLLNVDPSEWKP